MLAAGPVLMANKFELLVFVVFVLIALIRGIFNAIREANQKARPPRPPQRQAGPGEIDLQREIERFLGKVQKGGQRGARQSRPEVSVQVFEAVEEQPAERVSRPPRAERRPRPARAPVATPRAARAPAATPRRRPGGELRHRHLRPSATGDEVRGHVRQHILAEVEQFERQVDAEVAPSILSEVEQAVGPSRPALPDARRPTLQEVLPVLAAPDGWRQVVIAAELLQRPKALRRR